MRKRRMRFVGKEKRVSPMKYPSRTRFASLHEGLFFGGVLGLLLVLNGALDMLTDVTVGVLVLSVLGPALYVYAALRATYATGRLSSGMLAGLWTGLASSLINLVVLATLSMLLVDALRQRTAAHVTNAAIVGYDIGLLLFGTLVAVACGLFCGTIGGMLAISRGRARQAATTANEVE